MIEIENNKYNLIENYKDGFNLDDIKEKYTDYFEPYDYIIGDYSYGKLRLKGFCTKLNKICNKINDIKFKDAWLRQCPTRFTFITIINLFFFFIMI